MKRRVLSILCSMVLLGSTLIGNCINASATETEKIIEGSRLTTDEKSVGFSTDGLARGEHLMTGECSISKAGTKRIYTYGATTANHTVDYLAVIVYVDQYNEETERWEQIDAWAKRGNDDYFICTSKSITVDRGYYYRVHADHLVEKDGVDEETYSTTNGILVPK